jgi:hypothetical protein
MQKTAFPKIDISFSPTWWYCNYGMSFGRVEDWQDPLIYTEREREQRRLLYERFGDVGLGEADPQPDPLVGFEYGHRFMSAFWGCEVVYFPDQWPHAVPFPDAARRMQELKAPDLETSKPAALVMRNAQTLEERYGCYRALINFGAPLNNAVSVFGEEIFATCAADPELAERLRRRLAATIEARSRDYLARHGESGMAVGAVLFDRGRRIRARGPVGGPLLEALGGAP